MAGPRLRLKTGFSIISFLPSFEIGVASDLYILIACNSDLKLGKNDIMSQSSLESAMYYPCYDEGLATPDQMTGTYKEADFKRRE